MESSNSVTQIVVEHDGVDDDGGDVGKSLSKVEKRQRPEKSAKVLGSEKPSFLTSNTRLAFTKMGSSYIHDGELPAIVETFKNREPYQLQVRSSRASQS